VIFSKSPPPPIPPIHFSPACKGTGASEVRREVSAKDRSKILRTFSSRLSLRRLAASTTSASVRGCCCSDNDDDKDEGEDEDPIVVFFPNLAEITRRQQPGILGAPAIGSPSRTWAVVLAAMGPHVRTVIDAQRNVFDFASPAAWEAARQSVINLQDANNVGGWTVQQFGFPSIADVLIVWPKNASSVTYSLVLFP